MKTKLLAMMLLAGGSMFAQTRLSIGIDFGGHNGGFYQAPPVYAFQYSSRRFENHFRDNDRREFNRRFDDDRHRGFEQDRRGNRNGFNGQDTRQGHDSEHGSRGR